MATEEQAFRADQMLALVRSDAWLFYQARVEQKLTDLERKILAGTFRSLEDYKEACGRREAYRDVLRIPDVIRNEAGISLPRP